MSDKYKKSGVDLEKAELAVAETVKKFGILPGYASSVRMSSGEYAFTCDGIGTKTVLTSYFKKDGIAGIDLVAANFNDLTAHGALSEYIMTCLSYGKLDTEVNDRITSGILETVKKAGARLIGGETAELPGLINKDAYDLSAFAWGRRLYLFSPARVNKGDAVLSLPSSGLHCNGYSLIRSLFLSENLEKYSGELLAPSALYCFITDEPFRETVGSLVKNCANVTGGGIRRAFTRLCGPGRIVKSGRLCPKSGVYGFLLEKGVPEEEIENVFNCGHGFLLAVDQKGKKEILKLFNAEEIGVII